MEGQLDNIPRTGQGKTIAGRPQSEAGRTPRAYLASLPGDEAGWTPETYVTVFLIQLERTGRPLDAETFSYLLGSYLPGPGYLPAACWNPRRRRADLGRIVPDDSGVCGGARAAVRVL